MGVSADSSFALESKLRRYPPFVRFWLASTVFDGARAFEGVAPDLDLHCQRTIRSAHALGLNPIKSADELYQLAWEGIKRFPEGTELYIRPMFWADSGHPTLGNADKAFLGWVRGRSA